MRAAAWMMTLLLSPAFAAPSRAGESPRLFNVDHRSLVSRADLRYDTPVERSEEGMPVGNGRTGSLVWTTPNALRFQINRNDVFAVASSTHSFPRAHTDYSGGCAYVDVYVADDGPDVFAPGKAFSQHLSVYDGVMTANGDGVTARVVAWQAQDVIAIEIDDRRAQPQPVHVDLRMLRYANQYLRGTANDLARQHAAVIQTNAHTATMKLDVRDGRTILTQKFNEGDHYAASAVAAMVVGRGSNAAYYNESTVRITAEPAKGKVTILLASSASLDSNEDVVAKALAQLDAAAAKRFDVIRADNETFWADFWSRAFVRLSSDDGQANIVEQHYTYFLYVMASSSRASDYPTKFGGMLWCTNGDMRAWGSLYWWANQSCYYNGLAPANRFELLEPTFSMYSKMYDACAEAAREQWGSQGVWIPETTFFNGPEKLPKEIADEMRELYLLRKPWDQRSETFRRHELTVNSFSSRWNWIAQGGRFELGQWVHEDKGAPPFGHVTHIFGTTAKVAYLYWQRYEYTLDQAWLRDRAYPMIRGAAEFYRNFPNVKKEADGKYHVHHTNSNEPAWGVRDSDEDHAAMRGILPIAIRAAEILDVDADLRPKWRELLDNLAPMPTSDMPDALRPADYAGPRVFVKGLRPAAKPGGMLPDGNTLPVWNFELAHVEANDAELMKTATATLNAYLSRGRGLSSETRVGTLSRLPIAAAQMGRADAVRYMLPAQLRASDAARNGAPGVLRNRMALREGPGATECERLGRVAEALHAALLSSAPPSPGQQPIIRLLPAWPREWDADFSLLPRGNFLVAASVEKGTLRAVEIESRAGGTLRLRNPWPGKTLAIWRNGDARGELAGDIMEISTTRGEIILLVPAGSPPPAQRSVS